MFTKEDFKTTTKNCKTKHIALIVLVGLVAFVFAYSALDIGFSRGMTQLAKAGGGGTPMCSDGIDNDNDGYTDYPDDPGCYGPGSGLEKNQWVGCCEKPTQCIPNISYNDCDAGNPLNTLHGETRCDDLSPCELKTSQCLDSGNPGTYTCPGTEALTSGHQIAYIEARDGDCPNCEINICSQWYVEMMQARGEAHGCTKIVLNNHTIFRDTWVGNDCGLGLSVESFGPAVVQISGSGCPSLTTNFDTKLVWAEKTPIPTPSVNLTNTRCGPGNDYDAGCYACPANSPATPVDIAYMYCWDDDCDDPGDRNYCRLNICSQWYVDLMESRGESPAGAHGCTVVLSDLNSLSWNNWTQTGCNLGCKIDSWTPGYAPIACVTGQGCGASGNLNHGFIWANISQYLPPMAP